MARIYTRTGDGGETSLGDGSRVLKSGPRVALYGDVDELNSVVGCCVATLRRERGNETDALIGQLEDIQSRLFDLGTILADPARSRKACEASDDDLGAGRLEALIDGHAAQLEPLASFILPGGTESAATLHLARTVCRRCERRAVGLAANEAVPGTAIVFLNRLSDFLFTAARAANAAAGCPDVPWRPTRRPG